MQRARLWHVVHWQFMSHHQHQDWDNSLCYIINPPFPLVTIVVFSFLCQYLAFVGEGSIQYISTLCNTSQKISHCNWTTLTTDTVKHLWQTLSNTYDWHCQTLMTDSQTDSGWLHGISNWPMMKKVKTMEVMRRGKRGWLHHRVLCFCSSTQNWGTNISDVNTMATTVLTTATIHGEQGSW